jgi:hypothetical protein
MQRRISDHIRSNIVGYIALFCFAMGGSAYALDGPLPGQNQVGSDDIINSEVKGVDIGAGEVKNGDIGAFEIKANNIAPDSLGGAKIADRSVKNADLGLGASSSNTIADRGIQAIDVKLNALTGAEIDESSLDATVLQRRIGGSCAPGQAIRDVAQNGTVTCESTGGGGGSSWLLAGNAGTTGAEFLGTTDNQPLNFRVNNARGLRIEPASDGTNQSPNVIGGIATNSVTPGVYAATIGGGGQFDRADPATANKVTDAFGTIGGGTQNQTGDGAGGIDDKPFGVVAGGRDNAATGNADAIGGGVSNEASGGLATVAGGGSNHATNAGSTVSGGEVNTASGFGASVSGGFGNTAQGDFSLASGLGAQASDNGSFVWADSTGTQFSSTAQDQFSVRSTGGARLVSGVDGSGNSTSGLELPAGGSGWSTLVNGQPFDIRVNNARGLRIEPASDGTNQSPNVIGGVADNSVTAGVHSAVIGGGGRGVPSDPATANRVTDHQGVVGGGANNQAGDDAGTVGDATLATVGGGGNNNATGELSTVGGGFFDTASGPRSTVGGGNNNIASGSRATVPGGSSNNAQGDFSLAAGRDAQANHQGAFVWADSNAFQFPSTAPDQFNVRSTGGARLVSGIDGFGNPTSGLELPAGASGWSTLVNGQPFDISVNGARGFRIDPASDGTNPAPNVIGGSTDNSVMPGVYSATIGGGGRSFPNSPGTGNRVYDNFGTIGGGTNNGVGNFPANAGGQHATVGGGEGNVATGTDTTIGGGLGNTAEGFAGTVPGGSSNYAKGDDSFAAGLGAHALDNGSFVWADSSDPVNFLNSTAQNQFIARAAGHFFLQSDSSLDNQNGFINTSTGAYLSTGGAWTNASDKHLKAGFERVDPRQVLRGVNSMPVRSWHYKAERSVRHIGPVAQDFYRAFHVGEDNKHIATVDADGVALAAIKGLVHRDRALNQKVQRLQRTVASLKRGE